MLQMLQDRFREFARETESIGTERVTAANDNCDALIMADHSDSAQIAEWKDNLNEAWNDLLELMDTRTQMLQSSWELHKFYHDCKDILERILVCYLWMMKLMAVWLYLEMWQHFYHYIVCRKRRTIFLMNWAEMHRVLLLFKENTTILKTTLSLLEFK